MGKADSSVMGETVYSDKGSSRCDGGCRSHRQGVGACRAVNSDRGRARSKHSGK